MRTQTPLTGRESELDTLRTHYQVCTRGQPQIISIVAPPGVGKTRLAEELLREIEDLGCLVLRGYCESYLNAEPMQAVLQMIGQLLELPSPMPAWVHGAEATNLLAGRLRTLSPQLADHAAILAGILSSSSGQPRPSEKMIVDAVWSIVEVLARDRPVALFVDDWQWADDSTRAVLRPVGEAEGIKLLLLRASRELIPLREVSATINLVPLGSEQGQRMVDALVPSAGRFVVDQVCQASGGNPLFIEELCHAVAHAAHSDVLQKEFRSTDVPNNLNMLIESRVSLLSDEQKSFLKVLAVLGNVVPRWLAEDVLGEVDLDGKIADLSDLDLVFAGETDQASFRFKHGITRQVIFDTINPAERSRAHLQAAQAIERRYDVNGREPFIEMLAYHYGGTGDYPLAAGYAEAAGDKAFAAAAMDRARLQYQAALKALSSADGPLESNRWVSISQRFAQACLFDTKPEQCEVFDQAVALSSKNGDLANLIDAEYWLAYINYALGEPVKAMAHIDRARTSADQQGRPSLQTRILATWGQIRGLAGKYDEALPALDEALAQQKPYKSKPKIVYSYAYSLVAKAMILGDLGRFDEAFECFDEAEEATRGPIHQTHGSIMSMRAGVCLWQGRWDSALDCARRGIEIGDHTGSRYITASSEALAAYATCRLGTVTGADSMIRALSWIEVGDQSIWTSMHFSWLCELLVELDRAAEARHYAAWALQRARKSERLGEAVAYCALAEAATGPAADSHAARYFSRAYASADRRMSRRETALVTLKHAGFLGKNGRDHDRAMAMLEPCQLELSAMGMYWYAAAAQRLEAQLRSGASIR